MTKPEKTPPQKTKPLTGGVQHDARGNAVWQWATETARHAVTSTSQLLRRLDVCGLSLEDEQFLKTPSQGAPSKPHQTKPLSPGAAVKPAASAKPRGGFSAYDGAARPGAAAAKKRRPAASAPARSPWWRRLFQRR